MEACNRQSNLLKSGKKRAVTSRQPDKEIDIQGQRDRKTENVEESYRGSGRKRDFPLCTAKMYSMTMSDLPKFNPVINYCYELCAER